MLSAKRGEKKKIDYSAVKVISTLLSPLEIGCP
jgi:hypothetical protein